MPYITQRGLQGLKQYQYKFAGYTWLDDLHQPFWNGITELLPLWLAPNLITLIGTVGLIFSYALFVLYLPALEGPAPWWVFFSGGASVFIYLHLDCVDGKQARRTKSSSPLGQLFDHGCDALSVHLIVTNLAGSLGMGIGLRGTLFAAGVMGPWALAHWEEYHSGTMLYGTGYWGVTEANYLVVAGHLLTAMIGSRLWEGHLTQFLGWQLPWGMYLRRGDLNLILVVGGGIQQACGCIYRTLQRKIRLPPKERGHKQLGRPNALWHLIQLNLLFSIGFFTTLEKTNSIYHSRVLMATYGIAYAFEMSKLIMSHMSKEPFALDLWPTLLLSSTLVNSWLHLVPAYGLASIVNVLMLGGYIHYVTSTVLEICAYLQIRCFSIPVVSLK